MCSGNYSICLLALDTRRLFSSPLLRQRTITSWTLWLRPALSSSRSSATRSFTFLFRSRISSFTSSGRTSRYPRQAIDSTRRVEGYDWTSLASSIRFLYILGVRLKSEIEGAHLLHLHSSVALLYTCTDMSIPYIRSYQKNLKLILEHVLSYCLLQYAGDVIVN
jgi:hypothetical protein